MPEHPEVSSKELAELCACDFEFYCRTFFPHTFRQATPDFHRRLFDMVENPANQQIAAMVFRGGAKTTIIRALASKRIAYGISRTMFLLSASLERGSQLSLKWIKGSVENNRKWTDFFGLSRGSKWTDEHIEIEHKALGHTINVVAAGITGQVRGLNIDDYRPDFILVDDPCDDENMATPESRQKVSERFYGAIAKSLAPKTECPDAKIILLQTPITLEDLVGRSVKDPSWTSITCSCFDKFNISVWPERFPTDELRRRKEDHIRMGQLPLWLREMECTVISEEAARFRPSWLRYWETLPENLVVVLAIDPVPPQSERARAKAADTDFEALCVVGRIGGDTYLLEYAQNRGHEPEWTLAEFFRLLDKWHPMKVCVEGINYQRTLKNILQRAMHERLRFVQIDAVEDRRAKATRILGALSGIASNGRFFINRSHHQFYEQFISYPQVKHDDLLDATAMGVDALGTLIISPAAAAISQAAAMTPLAPWRCAP